MHSGCKGERRFSNDCLDEHGMVHRRSVHGMRMYIFPEEGKCVVRTFDDAVIGDFGRDVCMTIDDMIRRNEEKTCFCKDRVHQVRTGCVQSAS